MFEDMIENWDLHSFSVWFNLNVQHLEFSGHVIQVLYVRHQHMISVGGTQKDLFITCHLAIFAEHMKFLDLGVKMRFFYSQEERFKKYIHSWFC